MLIDSNPRSNLVQYDCCLPCPAQPFTLDNIFEAVKTVKSWRGLGGNLVRYDKLAAIQHQHVSGEARLKAVVEAFLLGEGKYQPSWRRLIHALHKAGESHLAEKFKTNTEAQQGEWVYMKIQKAYLH